MADSAVMQTQDVGEIEDLIKPGSGITSPLTPPTPEPLKDKTHVKLETLPVSSCGMMDRTRVALFAFMFTFLFINPLSYVVPQLDKGKDTVVLCLNLKELCQDIIKCNKTFFLSTILFKSRA